jgi:hypothetical protein
MKLASMCQTMSYKDNMAYWDPILVHTLEGLVDNDLIRKKERPGIIIEHLLI